MPAPLPRVVLTTASVIGALLIGGALFGPTFAENEAPEAHRIEKKIVIHHEGDKELTAAELSERLTALKETLAERKTDLAEASELLTKANEAQQRGETAVARALYREAKRLGACGPGALGMQFAPHMPQMGGMHFGPGAHKEVIIHRNDGTHGAKELTIDIEGDAMTAQGETHDGKAFDIKGRLAEVKAKLKELGITLEEHHGLGSAGISFGTPLDDTARAALEKELAAGTKEAARLFETGDTAAGLDALQELMGKAMQLRMGSMQPMMFGGRHFAHQGSAPGVWEMRVEEEIHAEGTSEAPGASNREQVESERVIQ